MRKSARVLTLLAGLCFIGGTVRAFFGRALARVPYLNSDPETYWRGATGLLLFAIVLLMLERAEKE